MFDAYWIYLEERISWKDHKLWSHSDQGNPRFTSKQIYDFWDWKSLQYTLYGNCIALCGFYPPKTVKVPKSLHSFQWSMNFCPLKQPHSFTQMLQEAVEWVDKYYHVLLGEETCPQGRGAQVVSIQPGLRIHGQTQQVPALCKTHWKWPWQQTNSLDSDSQKNRQLTHFNTSSWTSALMVVLSGWEA